MIDLHTHTDQSDGTLPPGELVTHAAHMNLEALAITDHDTFDGYDQAVQPAADLGVDLVCGIEISVKHCGQSVHLLGYFLNCAPGVEFRNWIASLRLARQARNRKLIDRLQSKGLRITLEEVRRYGKGLIGRPHFAAALVAKGYAEGAQQAFDEYLAESACCYVAREEPALAESTKWILAAGGLPVLAHPCRISGGTEVLDPLVGEMRMLGLRAIEVYHSDHSPENTACYLSLARRYSLAITGGSDFHGATKPRIELGTGIDGNLCVPRSVLDELRQHYGTRI